MVGDGRRAGLRHDSRERLPRALPAGRQAPGRRGDRVARAVLARRRRRRDDARPTRRDRGRSRGGRLRDLRRRREEAARPAANPGRLHARRRHQHRLPASGSRLELQDESRHAASSHGRRGGALERLDFVERLARARIGETYNQYAGSAKLCERLGSYLEARSAAEVVLVGEAAGYRGARVSGIPFTSERQLTGSGPAEATATIVHRALAELGVEDDVLLWNVVPTHPGDAMSNRRPTRAEIEAAAPFLREVTAGRRAIAVGRVAAGVLDAPYVRHPSHGGAAEFEEGLRRVLATIGRRRAG